ncbi:MAG: hypothetical protein ACFB0Z_05905 [Candidatus Phaeomarinobacter sp.]
MGMFDRGITAAVKETASKKKSGAKDQNSTESAILALAAGEEISVPEGARDGAAGAQWQAIATIADSMSKSAQLSQMVDEMPINVMMCDPEDFKINYVNKTSLDTLRSIEHLLPIKVDEIAGATIDVFHKNPVHHRTMLSAPANQPHKALIQ